MSFELNPEILLECQAPIILQDYNVLTITAGSPLCDCKNGPKTCGRFSAIPIWWWISGFTSTCSLSVVRKALAVFWWIYLIWVCRHSMQAICHTNCFLLILLYLALGLRCSNSPWPSMVTTKLWYFWCRTHDCRCIGIGSAVVLDGRYVVSKWMKLVRLQVECLGSVPSGLTLANRVWQASFNLAAFSGFCLALELACLVCGTSTWLKLTKLLSKYRCFVIEYGKGSVCLHLQFGETMPMGKSEQKSEDLPIVWLW